MQRLLTLILIVACATAGAEVFRRVGPDGEVYFSDTPAPGSQRVTLGTPQTVTLPEAVRRRAAGTPQATEAAIEKESVQGYAQFEIVKPSYGQGVRANDGSVTVYLSLQPALKSSDKIELTIDGEDGASIHSGGSLNFNLVNMPRGRHTVGARVKNAQGKTLIETGPVSFYVLRTALGR